MIDNFARSVAGPDRPIPQPKETTSTSPGNNSYADRANATKESVTSGANDLYNRLGSAVTERGQMLDGLEDTVNSLRAGSENMVAQVALRRLLFLPIRLLMTIIGEENCCRAVYEKLVQLLNFPTLGSACMSAVLWDGSRNRSIYITGVSDFSCTFLTGMGSWLCILR